jgi:hypothetical protein
VCVLLLERIKGFDLNKVYYAHNLLVLLIYLNVAHCLRGFGLDHDIVLGLGSESRIAQIRP